MSVRLTHVDKAGRARMVDVGDKPVTARRAVAAGRIRMRPATLAAVRAGAMKKGDVLAVARIAGIQAAKDTARWIPLCHTLPLDHVDVRCGFEGRGAIVVEAEAATTSRTGVEMEALVAVTATLLVIYDMCKGADRGMEIEAVRLLEKEGGRSGHWRRPATRKKSRRGPAKPAKKTAKKTRRKRR